MFIKNVEDFICEHCGLSVVGTGYTNHCPECLWSKHVDESPGDRRAQCLGLMEPVRIERSRGGEERVILQCVRCGILKPNVINPKDNRDTIVAIAKQYAGR